MKKPSVIKKNKKKLVLIASILSIIGVLALIVYGQTKLENCSDILKNNSNNEYKKTIIFNKDGGLYLLLEKENLNEFIGFIGPNTYRYVQAELINSGVLELNIEKKQECLAENGLVYTVIKGNYKNINQKNNFP